MKEYPSIPNSSKAPRQPCFGFVKYDGSNIRMEWSKKQGWYKFGTRTQLLDAGHPVFGRVIPIFMEKYADDLVKVFQSSKVFRGVDTFTIFGEFFGEKSFAGMHFPDDQKWDYVLFDVNPYKKGILSPKIFLAEFGHLKVAELVYQGNLNEPLIESVRESKFDCTSKYEIKTGVPEGIICKGGEKHKLWMTKIKTSEYREALKKRYRNDWEKYWEG